MKTADPMQTIEDVAERVLRDAMFRYFYNAKFPNTLQCPLDLLFPTERRPSSVLHGLATSLGTRLWQILAARIATEFGGFAEQDPTSVRKPIGATALEELISHYKDQRNKKGSSVELTDFICALQKSFPNPAPATQRFEKLEKSLGLDLLFSKNGAEWAIESKTVQINAGGGREFNEKIMRWYAYRYFEQGAQHSFIAIVAIPYNPYPTAWFTAQKGRISPLTRKDLRIEGEYWDFLANRTGAWEKILRGFERLASDQPLINLYKEAFQNGVSADYRLRVLAQHFGGTLVAFNDASASIRLPRWRCYGCGGEYRCAPSSLFLNPKTRVTKVTVCPRCSQPFRR